MQPANKRLNFHQMNGVDGEICRGTQRHRCPVPASNAGTARGRLTPCRSHCDDIVSTVVQHCISLRPTSEVLSQRQPVPAARVRGQKRMCAEHTKALLLMQSGVPVLSHNGNEYPRFQVTCSPEVAANCDHLSPSCAGRLDNVKTTLSQCTCENSFA